MVSPIVVTFSGSELVPEFLLMAVFGASTVILDQESE